MNHPFLPTFEPQAFITTGPYRNMLNMNYFATEETALAMMEEFAADHVEETAYPGGAPDPGTPPQRLLVWTDGLSMNAGVLAAFYTRNPEDQFPGLAEKMVWQAINSQRQLLLWMNGTGTGDGK